MIARIVTNAFIYEIALIFGIIFALSRICLAKASSIFSKAINLCLFRAVKYKALLDNYLRALLVGHFMSFECANANTVPQFCMISTLYIPTLNRRISFSWGTRIRLLPTTGRFHHHPPQITGPHDNAGFCLTPRSD